MLIQAEYSNNVWIDHCDVSSDRDHDKDYYDGLIDVCHPPPASYQKGSHSLTTTRLPTAPTT